MVTGLPAAVRMANRRLPAPVDPHHAQILRDLAKAGVERRGDASGEPFQLSADAWASIDHLLGQASAEATTRAYAAARRLFIGWWVLTFSRPFALPVPPEAIAQFIADFTETSERLPSAETIWVDAQLVKCGWKAKPGPIRYSTLKQRVAAVAKWHVDAEIPSPFAHPLVRNSLKAAKSAADDHGTLEPRRRNGLQRAALQALLATCDASDAGIRDRALLLFAWGTGGRRPSEVGAADIRNLVDRGDHFEYVMRKSKTQQAGAKARTLPLAGLAADAMRTWLAVRTEIDAERVRKAYEKALREALRSGKSAGDAQKLADAAYAAAMASASTAIFRATRGPKAGEAMSATAIGELIKRHCSAADLDGNFGGHSMRRGWVTQAWNDRLNPADIMAMSLHNSLSSVMVYNEAAQPALNPGAKLLDTGT